MFNISIFHSQSLSTVFHVTEMVPFRTNLLQSVRYIRNKVLFFHFETYFLNFSRGFSFFVKFSLSLTHQLLLFNSAAVLMLREMGRKQAKLLLQCFMFNATHFESIQPMCVMSCVIKTPERQSLNCETTGCERAIICTIHVQIKKFRNFFPS